MVRRVTAVSVVINPTRVGELPAQRVDPQIVMQPGSCSVERKRKKEKEKKKNKGIAHTRWSAVGGDEGDGLMWRPARRGKGWVD